MSRHLGDQVSAYVDRRLPGSALSAWDRHVVVCAHCRYAVDQERSLLASLRTAPAPCVSDSLQALQLGMGNASPNARFIAAAASTGSPVGAQPPVPAAPFLVQGLRLPTVSPAGPPRHRSARRAALVAGLAAGASAAAAWTVGLAPAAVSAAPAGAPVPAPTLTSRDDVAKALLEVGTDGLEVKGLKEETGALSELGALAAENLRAQRLGESAVRLAHEALEKVKHRRGNIKRRRLVENILVGQLVGHHKLGEVADNPDQIMKINGSTMRLSTGATAVMRFRFIGGGGAT